MAFKYTYFLLFLVSYIIFSSYAQEPKCVDGKGFFDGCNTCGCRDGVTSCTFIACPGAKYIPPPPDYYQQEEHSIEILRTKETIKRRKCVHGKGYFDGCNSCWCDRGLTACTFVYCKGAKLIPPPADFYEQEA